MNGEHPPYREFTAASLLVSLVIGVAMCAAFTYSGLMLGFTLAGSTIGAILGFAFLRPFGRGRGSILEVNQVQTGASAVNVASAGAVFTIPALFLMGYAGEFSILAAVLAATSGTLLGLAVISPLRKQMIEMERLRFPSGLAVASILKTPGESLDKALLLGAGLLISAVFKICVDWHGLAEGNAVLLPERIDLGPLLGLGPYTSVVFSLSLMNVAAGMLAGRGGLPFAFGAVLAWWILAPGAHFAGWTAGHEGAAETRFLYSEMLRPLGIGVLVGGALMGVLLTWPAIKAAFDSLKRAGVSGGGRDEAPASFIVTGAFLSLALLFLAGWLGADLPLGPALLTAVVGGLWLALAGIIVAQATGMTDISPISGMALIACTLMLLILGDEAVVPTIFIGAAVCVGASQCADMMQDLKTGHLVGARPWKQQLTQLLLTWIGPAVAVGTIYILWTAGEGGRGGFGPGTKLPAPQADALKAVVEGLVKGDVPWDKYALGTLLGGMVSLLPFAGIGVLVGLAMYLPAEITLSYGIGCLISIALGRIRGRAFLARRLVPFAAGLILGEALTALTLSLYQIAGRG